MLERRFDDRNKLLLLARETASDKRYGATYEIRRCLRGASNPRKFCEIVWLDRKLPGRLDDRGRDGIVSASRAERGHRAFVGAQIEAKLILFEAGMRYNWFGD